jgi:glycine cleavage system H protein
MSVLLAIATACVLIIWNISRKTRTRSISKPVFVQRYVHPGHMWMRLTDDGDVLVGIDEFAQSLIGTIESVALPSLLKRVEQGQVALTVQHGNRTVPLLSPVSGRVTEKNEMVLTNPSLVNSSPYGDGWLFRVRPQKLSIQLNNLFVGRATQQLLSQAKAHLAQMFSGSTVLMYQDGGAFVPNFADKISDSEWNMLAKEFLLVDENVQSPVANSKAVSS